jgi:hypothetical protein
MMRKIRSVTPGWISQTSRCDERRAVYLSEPEEVLETMRTEVPRMCCGVDAVFPDLSELLAAGLPPPVPLVGRDADESPPVVVVELCGFEALAGKEVVVPVTSMRCPLWLFSSVSWPSRMYAVPAPEVELELAPRPLAVVPPVVLPVVAVVEPDPDLPEEAPAAVPVLVVPAVVPGEEALLDAPVFAIVAFVSM